MSVKVVQRFGYFRISPPFSSLVTVSSLENAKRRRFDFFKCSTNEGTNEEMLEAMELIETA